MSVQVESWEYAEDRFQRIVNRNRYRYGDYQNRRNFDSVTRRMTNLTKLLVWANVLDSHDYSDCAHYARARMIGLQNGTVPRPQRLVRSTVERYTPIPAERGRYGGPNFVEFEFSAIDCGEN